MTYDEALSLLQLKRGYTESEKRAAYRRFAKMYHPDVNPSPAAEAVMRKINEANTYLETHKPPVNKRFTHKSLFDVVAAE